MEERAWHMWLVERQLCACEGCGGHLENGVCRSCRCTWRLVSNEFHRNLGTWAQWHPRYPGVCSAADRWYVAWTAEVDDQAARRRREEAAE